MARLAPTILATLILVLSASLSHAGPPPLPQEPGWRIVLAFDYAEDASAQAAWRPIEPAMPRVSVAQAGPRKALILPVRFKGNDLGRVAWDARHALDLSRGRAVCLRLYADEPVPAGSITLYLKSGAGYYSFKPSVPEPGAWRTVELDRMDARIEGKPGPWSEISEVRISPWRGGDKNGTLYVADFGVRTGDPTITFLRNDAAAAKRNAAQMRNIADAAAVPVHFADTLGIDYDVLSDLDVAAASSLAQTQVLVIPYAPNLAEGTTRIVRQYIENGGKLIAFYSLPRTLHEPLGIKHVRYMPAKGKIAGIVASDTPLAGMPPHADQSTWNFQLCAPIEGRSRVAAWWSGRDGKPTEYPAILVSDRAIYMSHLLLASDPVAKQQLFLSMLGNFLPDVWKAASRKALQQAEVVGSYANLDALEKAIAAIGGRTAARAALKSARTHIARGNAFLDQGNLTAAFAEAEKASSAARRAWCEAQAPKPGEKRAFWCHFPYGPKGMTWDEAVKAMANNGFGILIPNMLYGGAAYYPSKVLPEAPEVAEQGDAMRQCLDACKKYGVELHAWKVHWRIHKGPKAFQKKMRDEGRLQVSYDGTVDPQWLCPSNPANRKMEIDSMVEVARLYDIDGVHSDYIRFPGNDRCYCPTCRARFEKAIGHAIANWPADTRNDSKLAQQWNDWRRALITDLVRDISQGIHALPRRVQYSAAVFPNWPVCRDSKLQDWKVWCDRGYLDFICPMDYREDNEVFRRTVEAQKDWVGKVPTLPGIGLSVWPDRSDAVKVIEQIRITRELGAAGFTIFHLNNTEATQVLPLLGLGITRAGDDQ